MSATGPVRMEFKTELKQLLDLIIHSLYTKKEIFLRELISNAADAIDKVRFESLTNHDLLEGNSNWKIKLIPDKAKNTLTIRDNGIGMSPESIVQDLGTIARSGTRQFLENLKSADVKNRPELIGQFGVGFYASFMVADRVTVISRTAGPATHAAKWESDGQGQFTVESCEKESRGTDVILHLREDAKEFLDPWRLRQIVREYSDFIEHPITMDVEREKDGKKTLEEDTLNSRQAIWLRNKSDIKDEEYKAFYKQIGRDFEDPLKWVHMMAEGQLEFRAILFLPARKPWDYHFGITKPGMQLYVRRVLITHECENLLPPYLHFVKGVVDSSDLPLNVSRETLQHNPLLAKIGKNLVNRVLKTLEEMRDSEYEAYLKFYAEFGSILKGGVHDFENRERVADLLQLESTLTQPGKFTTLAKYVAGMPADQKEIYYLIGETRAQIENSPYIELYKSRGQEVLLLTDPVDEYVIPTLGEYKGKKFKPIDRAEAADSVSDEDKAKFKPLLESLGKSISEVKEIRLSGRLSESAAVLVADEHGMSAHMERLLHRMGRADELPGDKRILELNPRHPVVQGLLKLHEVSASDPRVESIARLLYDQAVIAEGSRVKDPVGFARRMNELIAKGLSL